jgi:hypothetical protein
MQTFIVTPVLLLAAAERMGYDDIYKHILVGLILFTVSCLFLVALAPTGKKNSGVVDRIIR